jgi:hypothetical protein
MAASSGVIRSMRGRVFWLIHQYGSSRATMMTAAVSTRPTKWALRRPRAVMGDGHGAIVPSFQGVVTGWKGERAGTTREGGTPCRRAEDTRISARGGAGSRGPGRRPAGQRAWRGRRGQRSSRRRWRRRDRTQARPRAHPGRGRWSGGRRHRGRARVRRQDRAGGVTPASGSGIHAGIGLGIGHHDGGAAHTRSRGGRSHAAQRRH